MEQRAVGAESCGGSELWGPRAVGGSELWGPRAVGGSELWGQRAVGAESCGDRELWGPRAVGGSELWGQRAVGSAALPGAFPSTGKVHTGAAEGPGPGASSLTRLRRSPSPAAGRPPGHRVPPERRAGGAPRPRCPLAGHPGTAPHAGGSFPSGPAPRRSSGTGRPRRSRLPPHGCPCPPPWPPGPAPPPRHGPRPNPACPAPCPASRRLRGARGGASRPTPRERREGCVWPGRDGQRQCRRASGARPCPPLFPPGHRRAPLRPAVSRAERGCPAGRARGSGRAACPRQPAPPPSLPAARPRSPPAGPRPGRGGVKGEARRDSRAHICHRKRLGNCRSLKGNRVFISLG
ncbi:basic salivary proline-rich protein 2-like [Motacilla alba alba]|uniref:basic salivary proline-rich protein 2-like n=1 Tax=Motacilla alba alba TaxID=1094192 RepID=UPI0018D5A0C1|nr:basic salivary proline-rich protein 2-like [Motacilla alba alba]